VSVRQGERSLHSMASGPRRAPRVALLALAGSADASWVASDVRLLEELGCRVTCHFWSGHWRGIPDGLRIARLIATHDLAICWFAYKQAQQALRVARLFGKPVAAVAGGFDTSVSDVYDPLPEPWQQARKWTLDHLQAILAISGFSAAEIQSLTDNDVEVLYLGADGERFRPSGSKSPIAITAASSINRIVLERKGIEAFLRAAAHVPDIQFQLVGQAQPEAEQVVREAAGPNVELLGRISDEELLTRLQNATVYVQASVHEGFGMAVAEAMLCECVPVVTRAAALPEVVGDAGIYVPSRDPEGLAEAVRKAMAAPEKGSAARERIIRNFPLSRRREGLATLLTRLVPHLYPSRP